MKFSFKFSKFEPPYASMAILAIAAGMIYFQTLPPESLIERQANMFSYHDKNVKVIDSQWVACHSWKQEVHWQQVNDKKLYRCTMQFTLEKDGQRWNKRSTSVYQLDISPIVHPIQKKIREEDPYKGWSQWIG